MKLNVQYTRRRRFNLRNDFFKAGEEVTYSEPTVSEGIHRNPSATYLVEGKVELHNDLRAPNVHKASTGRLGAGAILPGNYRAVFLEDSELRCLHITLSKDRAVYNIEERRLSAGQSTTISSAEGAEAFAVMIGTAKDEQGRELDISTLVEMVEEDITLTAVTDCVVNVGVKQS